MTFSIQSAINYNSGKYGSMKTVGVIQSRLGCATGGFFNAETVTAIHNWQKSPNRTTKLEADGKLGPSSLGVMILEMEKAGLNADAQVLRQYPFNLPAPGGETAGTINPISSFVQFTTTPLALRQNPDDPNRWMMKGSFRVNVNINRQETEPWRYEYRQYIKGYAFTQKGYWNPEKTIWTARDGASKEYASKYFLVPWGLDRNTWKEDGQVMTNGTIERFGYRSKLPYVQYGITDMYSPNQYGWDYSLQDTFGLEGPSERGWRIGVELYYRGVIIKDGKTEIASKNWGYNAEDAIRWID